MCPLLSCLLVQLVSQASVASSKEGRVFIDGNITIIITFSQMICCITGNNNNFLNIRVDKIPPQDIKYNCIYNNTVIFVNIRRILATEINLIIFTSFGTCAAVGALLSCLWNSHCYLVVYTHACLKSFSCSQYSPSLIFNNLCSLLM